MAVKAAKISVYAWEGIDRKGTKVTGELSAQNPALIKAKLRKQGISPGKVRKKTIRFSTWASASRPRTLPCSPGKWRR